MRREVGAFIAVGLLVFGVATSASAHAPSPSAAAGSSTATTGTQVCKTGDSRLTELSGIVATANGYAVVNDSQPDQSKEKIFFLDASCKLLSQVAYPRAAKDPEDLAIAKDGTIWVADIGDNSQLTGGSGSRRSTIALWKLAPGSKEPVIHRLAYPDGTARDAETLLLSPDGTPVIVTREPVGEVYVPTGPLQPNTTEGVKLKKVGTFTPQKTNTPNKYNFIGNSVITGGSVSPDGTKAVIRTFSDAYEFDVANGDVAKAVTSGKFRVTALPNEPQGEGITYTADGKAFVTCSDETGPTTLLRYTPATAAPGKTTAGAQVPSPASDKKSFFSSLTLQDLTYMVAGVGVFGLLLVVAGIIGIRRSRARRRVASAAAGAARATSGSAAIPRDDLGPDGTPPGGGGTVYGRPPGADSAGRASVAPAMRPESPAPGAPPRGTVYGAGPAPSPSYDDDYRNAGPAPSPSYDDDYRNGGRDSGGSDRTGARDARGGTARVYGGGTSDIYGDTGRDGTSSVRGGGRDGTSPVRGGGRDSTSSVRGGTSPVGGGRSSVRGGASDSGPGFHSAGGRDGTSGFYGR